MRILALETSSLYGSVAACEGDRLLVQLDLHHQQRTAQSLAPAIQELLRQVGWRPSELNLIAVTQGPGSFTGLRAGVTAAKVLAYACGAEVIGVNTLEIIATQAVPPGDAIWAVLDAERGQLFAALFDTSQGPVPRMRVGTRILKGVAWAAELSASASVTGSGLEKLRDKLPPHVRICPENTWSPQASTVGRLGWERHRRGDRGDLWTLTPDYYRPSAAEEKRALQTRSG